MTNSWTKPLMTAVAILLTGAGGASAQTADAAPAHKMLEGNVEEGKPFADMMPQLMRVPMAVDADGDGELSGEEVVRASERLKELDGDGDGTLDRTEMGAFEDMLPLIRWHRVTNLLDRDGDIRLSAEEIEGATASLAMLDKNRDFTISKEEMAMRGAQAAGLRAAHGARP